MGFIVRGWWGSSWLLARLLRNDSLMHIRTRVILSHEVDVLDLRQSERSVHRVHIYAHEVDHLAITLNLGLELARLGEGHLDGTLGEGDQLQVVGVRLAGDGLVGYTVGELLLDQIQLRTLTTSRRHVSPPVRHSLSLPSLLPCF